jgi:hypothetical protein
VAAATVILVSLNRKKRILKNQAKKESKLILKEYSVKKYLNKL